LGSNVEKKAMPWPVLVRVQGQISDNLIIEAKTMDYFKNLNEKQREAVATTEGPLLIIAGAGSGKTTTMTRRIAYLIGEKGVRPYNILAVTFTNKAANEMKERIEAIAGVTPGMWVMTFHAMCLRILRVHAEKIGYARDFTIYDTSDQKTVIKQSLSELEISDKFLPVNYVSAIISDCKNRGIGPDAFIKSKESGFEPKARLAGDVYKKYSEKLFKNNAMDFDDLLVNTVRLFNDYPDVLNEYSERFHYIMIDEYQDTNAIQYELVFNLAKAHKNICAVGDEDQCIYQWRGADIRNILSFEDDFPGAKLIKLEQNYRSSGNILAGANSVIENNTERKGKKLWTDREDGEKIKVYRSGTDKDEAFYIGREVHKLRDKGFKYKDIAILYRTHAQSRIFEEAFTRQDINYRVIGGTRFYDRKEIKDVISYLRLVQNHKDNLALKRVINEPKRGIGDKSIEKIEKLAEINNTSIFDLLAEGDGLDVLGGKAATGCVRFLNLISNAAAAMGEKKISEIYDIILDTSGYVAELEAQNTVEAMSRKENLLEFKSVIYDFEDQNPEGSLEEFMEKIALITDIDNHNADEDAIALMTLHSAKGLEFPIVFMPGMENETFPGRAKLYNESELEEERRLCYVGMTRAKETLYMSSAQSRLVFGHIEVRSESIFLKEIDEKYRDIFDSENNFGSKILPNAGKKSSETFRGVMPGSVQKKPVAGSSGEGAQNFTGGERVKHKKFGEGMVVGVNEAGVTVIFDKVGAKTLAPEYANLTVI